MALHNSAIGKHPKIAVKVISLPLTFSLCSLPFCFNWYFSLSPKRVQNKIDTTKRNTKHKRNERNVLNRDIHLVFSFRYSNSPFVIVLFTRLCVINFFLFSAVSGLGQVSLRFTPVTCSLSGAYQLKGLFLKSGTIYLSSQCRQPLSKSCQRALSSERNAEFEWHLLGTLRLAASLSTRHSIKSHRDDSPTFPISSLWSDLNPTLDAFFLARLR